MHPRDARAYGQSRRMARSLATVDGQRIAYVRLGTGAPTIIFLGGAGMDIDSWFKVLPEVASIGTVLAWDRPGVGRSDRPVVPQTGEVVVATLRELSAQAGLGPPYLLVAHSLGGLHAELFARCHPDEVCGLVLVEATSPDEAADPWRPGVTARVLGTAAAVLERIRRRSDGLLEVEHVGATVRQIRAAPAFPNVPVVVVSGGRRMRMVRAAAFAAHLDAQRGRVALSPRAYQVIAERSGHFPQLTEPGIVVAAIRDVAVGCAADRSVT